MTNTAETVNDKLVEALMWAKPYVARIRDTQIIDNALANIETRHTADIASSEVTGETSDGYHTFNELYEHRHALFIALLKAHPEKAWKSKKHRDGIMFDGWFIAGLETPDGQVTYHMPLHLWDDVEAEVIHVAQKWDGHTSNDVISRIKALTRPAAAQVDAGVRCVPAEITEDGKTWTLMGGWYVTPQHIGLELKMYNAYLPAPLAEQPDIGRKFKIGDRVQKTKGSAWHGRVVGFYSTDLTPIGYAVESEREPGSVQIYPEAAIAQAMEGQTK